MQVYAASISKHVKQTGFLGVGVRARDQHSRCFSVLVVAIEIRNLSCFQDRMLQMSVAGAFACLEFRWP